MWMKYYSRHVPLSPSLFLFEHPAEKPTSRGKQLVNGLQSLEKQGHLTIGQSRNGLLRIYLSTLTFEQRSHDFFRSSKHFVPFWMALQIHVLIIVFKDNLWKWENSWMTSAFDLAVNKGFFPVKQLIAQLSTKDQWIATQCTHSNMIVIN